MGRWNLVQLGNSSQLNFLRLEEAKSENLGGNKFYEGPL
jgi:hypothetical protein